MPEGGFVDLNMGPFFGMVRTTEQDRRDHSKMYVMCEFLEAAYVMCEFFWLLFHRQNQMGGVDSRFL